MRIRAPANVHLLRAQVILILGALIPTILTTPLGVILLASRDPGVVEIVTGVLVLAFAASSLTGFLIGGIFLRRGSALVTVQQDFLSSVSHELRTPMTSMRMFVEALLDDRLTDPQERANCLNILKREIDRLDALVARLMELSRLEANRYPYDRMPVPVETIVEDALHAFEALQAANPKRVVLDIDPQLVVVGDRPATVQVLVNLLSNADKYSAPGQPIQCSARASGDREVELIVRDHGRGIPVNDQERVFEKFWRGRHAVESGTPGSGLGLAIVKGIVKAHRGRVEIRSPADGGAAVHVFLPRHPATAEAAP